MKTLESGEKADRPGLEDPGYDVVVCVLGFPLIRLPPTPKPHG